MLYSRSSFALGLFAAAALGAGLSAAPVCDADNGGITLPQGFCALVVADGLGKRGIWPWRPTAMYTSRSRARATRAAW